jgi:hypothetical protein
MFHYIRPYLIRCFFFFLHVFLFSSCLFEREKENFLHVDDSPDQKYTPRLLYFSSGNTYYDVGDTLWLVGEERLQLTFSGLYVYGYEVGINGESVTSSDKNNPFFLTANGRQVGAYTLNLKVFVPAGTYSLADKLQAEYAAYTSTVVLMITNRDEFKPEFTSIVEKDGTIELTWKRYPGGNFVEYEIRKYEPGYGYMDSYRTLKVTDQHQTTLNDTTYVGGTIIYAIAVNRAGSYIKSKDYRTQFSYNPKMELSSIGPGRARLKWDKPSFYKNIHSIKVTSSPATLFEGLWTNQEYVEFDITTPFATLGNYTISFTGKAEDAGTRYGDRGSVTETLTFGKRIPSFDDLEYNSPEKSYYLIHVYPYYTQFPYPHGIYKLDNDLNIVDSVRHNESGNIVQSPDGNHLYLVDSYRARKIEKNPLRIGNVYWPETGSFSGGRSPNVFVASNNNLIYFLAWNDYDKIVNPLTKEILLNVKSTGVSHFSPNGQYFIDGRTMYQFDGTTFFASGSLPYYDQIYFVNFLNDNQRLMIATQDHVILYNFLTGEEEANFPFVTYVSSGYFNASTNKYSVFGPSIQRINVISGEVEMISKPVDNGYTVKLEGDYLFNGRGFAQKQ